MLKPELQVLRIDLQGIKTDQIKTNLKLQVLKTKLHTKSKVADSVKEQRFQIISAGKPLRAVDPLQPLVFQGVDLGPNQPHFSKDEA